MILVRHSVKSRLRCNVITQKHVSMQANKYRTTWQQMKQYKRYLVDITHDEQRET